jgi:NAD(P)-dependent dehydrogenase (short-subunit alcohol dehydrogenase family)
LAEILADDDLRDVGVTPQQRWKIQLDDQPLRADHRQPLDLDLSSVLLLLGGAAGITGEVAKALAQRYRCRLVLVGRSAMPGEEPEELRSLGDEQSLRRHMIEQALAATDPATPSEIDARLRRLMHDREIRENLSLMSQAGATVEYHCCDVSNAPQFAGLIEEIYQRHGRIDGVIHGAGIIEDRKLRDKSTDSVARVFNTKVVAARVLAESLRPRTLRFLLFFSSAAAKFGNAGQSDYAAANECLSRLAQQLDVQWPGRVVAINWGPWDRGMVTGSMARMFRKLQLGLIAAPEGVESCLAELEAAGAHTSEVIIGCDVRRLETIEAEAAVWT